MDIDEAGVNRLQTILTQNRDLANQLAAAFNTARASMMDFIQSATEELSALPFFSRPSSVEETLGASGTFSIDLDFTKASKKLETFLASAKKQFKLTADGSGIVSAAFSALSQVRSMFASAGLVLKVKTEVEKPGTSDDDSDGHPGGNKDGRQRLHADEYRVDSPGKDRLRYGGKGGLRGGAGSKCRGVYNGVPGIAEWEFPGTENCPCRDRHGQYPIYCVI